jgi:catechol 2,3-dioxygenase-like lactoylglutathione lyase family enzyme
VTADLALDYRFTHVHVYASDPAATVRWLTDGLGGEVAGELDRPGFPVTTEVRLGGQLVFVRGSRDAERFAEPGPRTFGLDHFGLSVQDVAAAVEVLRARGIEPDTTFNNGLPIPAGVAYVRGPDDLLIEISRTKPR